MVESPLKQGFHKFSHGFRQEDGMELVEDLRFEGSSKRLGTNKLWCFFVWDVGDQPGTMINHRSLGCSFFFRHTHMEVS